MGGGLVHETRGLQRQGLRGEEWSQSIQAFLWLMLDQAMTDFLASEPSGMLGTQW